MNELVQQSIRLVEAKVKKSVPWSFDEPYDQPYYKWDGAKWIPMKAAPNTLERPSKHGEVSHLALLSWNIDFMLPYPDSRMRAALRHMQDLVAKQSSTTGIVIFLNECLESDLKLLAANPWVQDTFNMTDLNIENWQSGHYGTTTLIDKRLSIKSCFRVHYSKSRMERDGLFVDIQMGNAGKTIRLCNTHLESLAFDPPFRPPQMELCASYMHEKTLAGAILAGDLNAIQDFDKHLHSDNGLKDAYLELGGKEDDAENGHTWGQQAATAQRERFGTSRMDKVLYCGGVECRAFERFGMGVEVEDEGERERIVRLGFERAWITDHFGVMGVFGLTA